MLDDGHHGLFGRILSVLDHYRVRRWRRGKLPGRKVAQLAVRSSLAASGSAAGVGLVTIGLAAAAGLGVGSRRVLSSTSDEALRNSRIVRPRALPTSGSLPGPMTRSARMRTMTSSSGPMLNGMGSS